MQEAIRQPAVAGRFYPGEVGPLTGFLEEHLVPSHEAPGPCPRALVAPHAGYVYSGATAARAFAKLQGHTIERVLLLGPSHYVAFRGISVAPHQAFRTPLGDMPLDTDACRQAATGDFRFSQRPDAHRQEHSLEVELPFLQHVEPFASLIPIVCGQMTVEDIRDVAEKLLPLWDARTLLVVSTDFTHYGDHFGYWPFGVHDAPDRLPKLDGGAIEQIQAGSMEGFLKYVEETGATICGRFPLAVMLAMQEMRGTPARTELLEYTTSGAMTGSYRSSVSYAAIAVYEGD